MEQKPASPIPDLHKGAFWIYGVTAMIMREPLALMVRRLSEEGIQSDGAREVCLRTVLVLLILSRQFLSAGSYFDRVYMRADSVMRFPRRHYPVDFLLRLTDLLGAVAASTAAGLTVRGPFGLSPFALLVAMLMLSDSVSYLIARWARFSAVNEVAPSARVHAWALLGAILFLGALRFAGLPAPAAEAWALLWIALFTAFLLGKQIREYGQA